MTNLAKRCGSFVFSADKSEWQQSYMLTIERKMCAEIRSGRSMGREMIPLSGWKAVGE
ncbi:MAG: hypothetical protein J5990_09670 [Bacteroidales bacterium]|nr:hypothetical protein [Bacteroidales bacterium]